MGVRLVMELIIGKLGRLLNTFTFFLSFLLVFELFGRIVVFFVIENKLLQSVKKSMVSYLPIFFFTIMKLLLIVATEI